MDYTLIEVRSMFQEGRSPPLPDVLKALAAGSLYHLTPPGEPESLQVLTPAEAREIRHGARVITLYGDPFKRGSDLVICMSGLLSADTLSLRCSVKPGPHTTIHNVSKKVAAYMGVHWRELSSGTPSEGRTYQTFHWTLKV